MPLTKEEMEQIGTMIGEAVATNTSKAIEPLQQQITALQANQQQLTDTITANSRAEEQTMREAVKVVHGELVANALSGDALKDMYSKLGNAAPLGANSATQPSQSGAPDASTYFPA